jgi:hypothetical protein
VFSGTLGEANPDAENGGYYQQSGDITVVVTGDLTGATTSGSFSMTTINGAGDLTDIGQSGSGNLAALDQLTLVFTDLSQTSGQYWAGGDSLHSQVNVSSATSLAAALNLAAQQAEVQSVQFNDVNGNVTVPASPSSTLLLNAHTSLLDWFQYNGDTYILEVQNSTSNAQAHNAMASNDVLVKLQGLVDVNQLNVDLYHPTII